MMKYYDNICTLETDYESMRDGNIIIWRSARVINSNIDEATIADGAYCKDSTLERKAMLNRNAFCLHSNIGERSQIGFNSKILYSYVGKYCSISWDCSLGGANHSMNSISTFTFSDLGGRSHYQDDKLIVGNDVWIASGCTVLRGVTIGDGAVVTRDVMPYEVVGGVPAKHLKWRFDETTRKRLLKIKWWDFPREIIESHFYLFQSKLTDSVLERFESLRNGLEG